MTQSATPHAETLEAALPLFLRFGYRKTSMDELARASGISRQGLYLRFSSKKALFVAMVDHLCDKVEAELEPAFAEPADLVAAFDAYLGAFVAQGASHATADEIVEVAKRFRGERLQALEAGFQARLVAALAPAASPQMPAESIAAVLAAASHGFKHSSASRADYRASMSLAVALATRTAEKA